MERIKIKLLHHKETCTKIKLLHHKEDSTKIKLLHHKEGSTNIKLLHHKEGCTLSIQRHEINLRLTESFNTSIGVNLIVTPDVLWLDESNGFSDIFNVKSNTDWIIIKEE